MKSSKILFVSGMVLALVCFGALAQTVKPEIEDIALVPHLTIRSEVGVTNVIEYAEALATNQWLVLTYLVVTNSPYVVEDLAAPAAKRFYRVVIPGDTNVPAGMVLIPAGLFTMGDALNDGYSNELPTHSVQVSAFYMDKYEVTKALWDEVKTWAVAQGYDFNNVESGKAANHPVQTENWYDMMKWCNARSEKEGRVPAYYTDAAQTTVYRTGPVDVANDGVKWHGGYRLPTEAEWEKAGRGGASGQRFPWGDTITQSQANYISYWPDGKPYYAYDRNPTEGIHPDFQSGGVPYTSPVGSFAPNGYGLYDMAGNVAEWCWDSYGLYSSDHQTDPHGPTSGSFRVIRGGGWFDFPVSLRCSFRLNYEPGGSDWGFGFRCVLGQP